MQRKRIRLEELSALLNKSLGQERSVSRNRDPSQNIRGNSSTRTDPFTYIPANQRDRHIGEPNSDSRREEFYDRRHEAESCRDRGQDYGKDRERDRHSGNDRDSRGSGRDTTPDRRSHFKERVDDHKMRTEDARDKKAMERRCDSSPHSARERSSNRAWSADYINKEATAAWLLSMGIKHKECSVPVCSGIGTPQQICVPYRGSYTLSLIIYNNLLVGDETISITANEIPSTCAVLLGRKTVKKIIYPSNAFVYFPIWKPVNH